MSATVVEASPRAERRRGRWNSDRGAPYLFLAPAVTILLLVTGIPIAIAFGLSFVQYQWNAPNIPIGFVGLDNYLNLVRDANVIASISWTVIFTLSVLVLELSAGMVLALLLHGMGSSRLGGLARAVFLIPLMMSGVITGFMWRLMYDPEYGPINHLLGLIGMDPVSWFSDQTATRLVVILADTWLATPFVMLILLAGLQSIPTDYYEAARVDGASQRQSFFRITLPLLRYPILVVLLIRTMDALRAFDLIYLMTRGGPGVATSTVMMYDYKYAFSFFQMGRASALSFAFLIVIGIIAWVYMRLLRREAAL